MVATRRRASAAGLVLALLLAFVGWAGPPAAAAPSPAPSAPSLPAPGFPIGQAPTPESFGHTYYYDSLDHLWDEVSPDDPRLMDDRYLNNLGPHASYSVGQVEHLLTAWFDSEARAELKDELADLEEEYADRAEKQIAEQGLVEEADREQVREKFRAEFEQAAKELIREHWTAYLGRYINVLHNKYRGAAFEEAVARWLGINPDDPAWHLDERFPGSSSRRRGDIFSVAHGLLYEVKSGNSISEQQLRAYLAEAERLGLRILIVFNQEPTAKTQRLINKINAELRKLNQERAAKGQPPLPLVEAYHLPMIAEKRERQGSGAPTGAPGTPEPPAARPGAGGPTGPRDPRSGPPGSLTADGHTPADSAADEVIANSPDSPADAAATARVAQELAVAEGYESAEDADMLDEPLGGVDFSTLELRYISDTYDGGLGTGVRYAYQIDAAPGAEVSYGGKHSAQLAADAFFTWLVLPPESFTVNLNPDEPDRIIDERLGRTDAGRVLLEADLQMKKTVAKLIHPDTARGRAYWRNLRGENSCLSTRQWIVPRPAVVRENGNELFIIDAPLEVKMEIEYFRTEGVASANCPKQSKRDTEHNEEVYRKHILPELEKAVNTAPEYADLRRVYASRVAAEWYRQRSERKTTAYGHLIDSGDVTPWQSRVSWDPKEVFDRFVKSYRDGEFRVKRTTRRGNTVVTNLYVYGGVDFINIPKQRLSGDEFARTRPTLDSVVQDALRAPAVEQASGAIWLGGWSTERPLSAPYPMPQSPLGKPQFYALTALPLLAWLIVGGYLLVRRRRASAAAAPPSGPVPTAPAGS